jgi:signal transduction histidine kinase
MQKLANALASADRRTRKRHAAARRVPAHCCLDEAVAHALSEYARLHELSIAAQGAEPMGVFAHELRTLIGGAALAFDTLRDGHVPASGKTAAVLGRNLQRMRELVDRSLAEVRLQAHLHHPQCIRIAEVLEEVEISATAEAKARALELVVHDYPELAPDGKPARS